ncbi:sn1-specific diacylglycerol lipase alpha [Colletotrichum spaethianum]|uniref:Sn1-specific diacylglycerol lipase alpha n=1 Tax=Colletotrichum spaethianum TaxID=700344 RepID=A0AA37LFF9_9PEZI|nr:sn1-specific diacylglycerol lipase alpha [Colletotrichum spaethianum]GKT46434.1 sn1-specific diacylglycerol lipase alpha [Colletotrichum spaethianum]
MATTKLDDLVAEFPLLDPTVVIAIASEVDLNDDSQLSEVRGMLQSLAQNVLDEEASGFNASGVPDTISSMDVAVYAPDSSTSTSEGPQPKDSDSSGTTLTSPPPSEPDYDVPRIKTFDGDSDQEKISQLQEMFSDLKPHDVNFALKKAQGDFQTALETLLNIQFLESIGERPKGIDGFIQSENTQKASGKRKGKGKKRKDMRTDLSSSSSSIKDTPPINDDNERVEKILFVVEKLDLPFEEVSDVFDARKGSLELTIVEFLDQYIKQGVGAWSREDNHQKQHIQELKKQFRHVPEHYLPPLNEVTQSNHQWTEEVAALLNRYFGKLPAKRLDISYKLAPLTNAELEGSSEGWQKTASPKLAVMSPTGRTLSTPAFSAPSSAPNSYRQAMETASVYRDASNHSYSTAGQVYKKGHLYRQAAGYYAERGREEARSFAKAKSVAADIHVASTSSTNEIDLHGVEVADGVRIARERVWDWWNNLGEYRARKAQEGFTIVTGRGLHSAGGVSRLRQGVIAALVNDGWKVSIGTGSYRVTGRR